MTYADLHTHTHLSFDSDASLAENCLAARQAGITTLAITNHFDFDGILDGIYPVFDPEEDRREVEAAREAFPDLRLLYSIEMGQIHTYSGMFPVLQQKYGFDYLLASLHNLEKLPDFSFLRFERMSDELIDHLLRRYFSELTIIARTPGITTLAHLTYPMRYIKQAGKTVDPFRYEAQLRSIFHILIESGVNLEVNTSGFRQGVGESLPGLPIVALYRDCGGRKVAVGSDAHFSEHIGAMVKETTDRLAEMGMEIAYT